MRDATAPHAARVSAATAILDRGHGKPTQPISRDEEMPPLGISIFGGLLVSPILTLYTTPVIYLYLDRLRLWGQRRWRIRQPRLQQPSRVREPGE